MLNSPPPVPTTPGMSTPTTTPPVPTYDDLLAVADADAARTRPAVAHLRTLVPAVSAEAIEDDPIPAPDPAPRRPGVLSLDNLIPAGPRRFA